MRVVATAESHSTYHCKCLSTPIKTASHFSERIVDLLVVCLLPVLDKLDKF